MALPVRPRIMSGVYDHGDVCADLIELGQPTSDGDDPLTWYGKLGPGVKEVARSAHLSRAVGKESSIKRVPDP